MSSRQVRPVLLQAIDVDETSTASDTHEFETGKRELAGATIGLACGIACFQPTSSLFFHALEHSFGWSKSITAASLIAMPITGVLLPMVGRIIDWSGVRLVALISSLLLSCCFFGLSLMPASPFMFWALFLATNVLGAATGPVAYTRVITASFRSRRGTALAIALVGIGLSAIVLPQILTPIVEHGGWRGGYRILSLYALIGGLIAFALLSGRSSATGASTVQPGIVLGAALRTRAFWLLTTAVLLISTASLGFVSQFQSLMIETGISPIGAGRLISLLGASVCVSRLAMGRLLDSRSPEVTASCAFLLAAAGMTLLRFDAGRGSAIVAILLIGVSIGAELDLLSFFCAKCFGLRNYSSIYGVIGVFFYFGIAVGGLFYGKVHDLTGSYRGAITASAVMFLIAALSLYCLPHQEYRLRRENTL